MEKRSWNSRCSHGEHSAISLGSGLLPGGAHRTAQVIRVSRSSWPSRREELVSIFAKPLLNNERYNQSPELSPVKIRPVLFAPCAPGARPTITTLAFMGPKPVTGLPQYFWSAYARRLICETSVRHSTKREQASHSVILRSRVSRLLHLLAISSGFIRRATTRSHPRYRSLMQRTLKR
mgnify:CR=1 FL=1